MDIIQHHLEPFQINFGLGMCFRGHGMSGNEDPAEYFTEQSLNFQFKAKRTLIEQLIDTPEHLDDFILFPRKKHARKIRMTQKRPKTVALDIASEFPV